jgi:hypothetical protein
LIIDIEAILKMSDRYTKIKYEDKQTKVMPRLKLSFLLGLIICHKKGIVKSNIGYADMPSLLFTPVNQKAITTIK